MVGADKDEREKSRWSSLKYSADLTCFLEAELKAEKRIVEEELPLGFQNLILQGPPGTGKTALAENYAYEVGMEYVFIPGAAWAQLDTKEKVHEFYSLFNLVKKSEKPILIFIDEIDAVFMAREGATDDTQKLISAFLERVPDTFDPKIKWVGATNHIQRLDSAVRSRFGREKEVLPPCAEVAQELFKTFLLEEAERLGITIEEVPEIGEKLEEKKITGRTLKSFAKLATRDWLVMDKTEISKNDLLECCEKELKLEIENDNNKSEHVTLDRKTYEQEENSQRDAIAARDSAKDKGIAIAEKKASNKV